MNVNATTTADSYAEALRAKIITMVCTLVISMFVGCMPMLISLKYDWFTKSTGPDMRTSNKLVLGLLAFGGGVLFATSFMHLLPEVGENIELLQESGAISDVPIYLAGLIMCCGFFMMYIIEQLVHMYIDSRSTHKSVTSLSRTMSLRKNSGEANECQERNRDVETHNHSHFAGLEHDDGIMSAFRGLFIVLALSIHELFEGLAVGLESSVANVWYMFGAVSAHKYIMAFCIGVELLAAGTKRWLSLLYIFVFSFCSALGIGIGILMVGGAGAADAGIISVVLQGLACGTLVYVVFFEVWRAQSNGLMDLLCSLLGFTIMVLLQFVVQLVAER